MSCNSPRIVFSLACCEKAERAIREETPNWDSLQSFLSSLQNKKELQQSVLQTIRKLPPSISLINFMCMSSLVCTIKLCKPIWRINSDPKKLTTKSLLPHPISHILTLEHDTPTSCFTFTSFQMSLLRSLIAVAGPLRNSAHHLSWQLAEISI